ncbi:peptidoglycan recognition protein family protein [Paenibacillus sp. GYB003]|uniref:peptidoglycan recognition protein family protein n=1 Tax=Paenibacillus sp. GYB003 TaxID=2994392 RepID=UPI002F962E69
MTLRNIPVITGLPFDIKPVIDITDQLPSRKNDPNAPRTIEQITHVSVHHSAVEGGSPQAYANYHVNTLGWYHIGYHDVIVGDQIYQVNDLLTFSYHTSGHNPYTVGISISGDLSKRPLSEMERNCLYARLLTYLSVFPNLTIENILGHNEYPDNKTACPCIDMNRVRNDVRDLKMKLDYANRGESREQIAFKIAESILWTYNAANGIDQYGEHTISPEGREWAKQRLLLLEPVMREHNFIY